MCALAVVLLVIVILAASLAAAAAASGRERMQAAPATDGIPVRECTTTFYTKVGPDGHTQYCVRDGGRPELCQSQALPAIIAANERSSPARCSQVVWGFGCDRGLLCGLQQSGPNLSSYMTASKLAKEQCGEDARLVC